MAACETLSEQSGGSMGELSDTFELPVCIGGVTKWVTGLTKRTTCDDVIYALLLHVANPADEIQGYAIFECWKGVERPLSGRTKILKVWKAWGHERHSVCFSVRKLPSAADFSAEMAKSRRARLKRAKSQSSIDTLDTGRDPRSRKKYSSKDKLSGGSSKEKRNRGSSKTSDEGKKSQAFHDLVKRILCQEREIQEQLSRVQDLDSEIENYEKKVFLVQANSQCGFRPGEASEGVNDSLMTSEDELFPAIKANDLEAYMHICQNILELQDKISAEQSRVMDLSLQLAEESQISEKKNGQQERFTHEEGRQLEALDDELSRSMLLSSAQKHQMSLVNSTLYDCDNELHRKKDCEAKLVRQLEDLTVCNPGGSSQVNESTSSEILLPPGLGLMGQNWVESEDLSYWRHNPYVDVLTSPPPAHPPPSYRTTQHPRGHGDHYLSTEQLYRPQRHTQQPPGAVPPTDMRHARHNITKYNRNLSHSNAIYQDEMLNSRIRDSFTCVPSNNTSSHEPYYLNFGPNTKHQGKDHDDSDTGLSSLHSSDESGTTMLETLV